jgi:hypothetical protein
VQIFDVEVKTKVTDFLNGKRVLLLQFEENKIERKDVVKEIEIKTLLLEKQKILLKKYLEIKKPNEKMNFIFHNDFQNIFLSLFSIVELQKK